MSDTTSDAGVGGGDAWAAFVGSLGVMGNTLLSSWLGNKSNKKAQSRAFHYWKRSLRDGPSLSRQGLESAGFNPMLALGSVGGQSFSASSTPSFAPVGDLVGGAEAGARLGNQLLRGIKLDNKKKELENENLESDLDTKEVERLQKEANISLLQSQSERSDLAYGRDIADTITTIAGTGAHLYSAKAMADVAKQNAVVNARNATVNERRLDTHTTETHYDRNGKAKGRTVRATFSQGEPVMNHTASPKSKPNVMGRIGGSAKAVGRTAVSIGKFLGPLLVAPIAESLARDAEERSLRIQDLDKRDSGYYKRKYWQPKRVLLH